MDAGGATVSVEKSSSSGAKCKQCGELSLRKDYINSQEQMVCEKCGYFEEVITFSEATTEHCQKGVPIDGPTRQGRFFVRTPQEFSRLKVRRKYFLSKIREMARKVNLPQHETTLLEEEGKNLLSGNGLHGAKLTRQAAGLVFVALQRQNHAIRFKEVAPQLGITVRSLGRVVKVLKKQPCISKPSPVVNAEERIQAVMDKLPSPPPIETRVKVKKMALDLKDLCGDMDVHGFLRGTAYSIDCAIATIALETIKRKQMTEKWISDYAKNAHLTPRTLKTNISHVSAKLVTLAKEVPSLSSRVESDDITSRNILQYVPIIIQNKVFLMDDPDEESEEDKSSESEQGGSAVDASACCSRIDPDYVFDDTADDNLSDYDEEIQEYIATDKEVAGKLRRMKRRT